MQISQNVIIYQFHAILKLNTYEYLQTYIYYGRDASSMASYAT